MVTPRAGRAAPGSPFKAEGVGPFGSEFRPTNPDQLFVSNAHNGVGPDGVGKVGAFAVNGGSLTELSSSPTSLPAGATPAGIVVN
jgi:hypothetical protein